MSDSRHVQQVRARFSAAARSYDADSALQKRVAARLLELVPPDAASARILDVGCGTGHLTACARARWPLASIDALDLAPGMVARAIERFAADEGIAIHQADATRFHAPVPYDVVASSSTLHWLRPLAATMTHLARLVRPGGCFAAALMLEGTLRELHDLRSRIAPDTAARARLPAFQEVTAAIHASGLQVFCSVVEEQSFAYASAEDLLRTLNQLGVTSGDLARGARPLARRELRTLCDEYARLYALRDGVRATYVVGYLVAHVP